MKGLLPRRYSFRYETLPVLVAGMALNLVTHFLIEKANINFIWGDMGGTALVAILLGPWWGATIGIFNSAITGSIQSNYFPFGLEQVVGALTWGYLARQRFIRTAIFQKARAQTTKNLVYSYLLLVAAGGLVTGIVATSIKLVLYPKMGLPLDTRQKIYLYLVDFVLSKWPSVNAEIVSLFMGDLIRELTDKTLMVLLALIFARFMGFIPDTVKHNSESSLATLDRFRTDALSILVFTFTYGVYLLAARIISPEISIRPLLHPTPIYWLRDGQVLILLYTPIVLALISFLMLSYGPHSSGGRRLDAERRRRESLYNLLSSPKKFSSDTLASSEVFRLLKADGVYGLLFTVLLWPTKGSVLGGAVNSILIYFAVMAAFAAVFFFRRREFSVNFCRAQGLLATLHSWLEFPNGRVSSENLLVMLIELFSDDLKASAGGVKRQDQIVYVPAFSVAKKGYLRELTRDKPGCGVLLIVVDKPGDISTEVRRHTEHLLNSTRFEIAMIIALSPAVGEEATIEWLKREEADGRTILLVGPEDIEDTIYEKVKTDSAETAFVRGRMHAMDALTLKTAEAGLATSESVEKLAARALPYLAHVLAGLPSGSLVLDLGAGRGRHVVAALNQGHSVFAVEQNETAYADLRSFTSQLGDLGDRLRLKCEDYLQTDAETVGLVDLVIITGVLQHTSSPDDLRKHLSHIRRFMFAPGSKQFIEMLFDMKFDGKTPADGRHNWTQGPFEEILESEFPPSAWKIEMVRGPLRREQCFDGNRSFIAASRTVACTSVEYLISREC